ncbi:hypothetical protein [Blautia sp.]|mgnify:FL=1
MKYEQFCTLINDVLAEKKEILPEDCLASDLGMCSFDLMMLICLIEKNNRSNVNLSLLRNDMTVREFFEQVCGGE